MLLGKVIKDTRSGVYIKVTGISFVVGLLQGDLYTFVEMTGKVVGMRNGYKIKRLREKRYVFEPYKEEVQVPLNEMFSLQKLITEIPDEASDDGGPDVCV